MMETLPTENEIASLVYRYVESIDKADTELAATVWSASDDLSFIHPKGDERGWDNIVKFFYEKLMRDKFSRRELRVYDLDIHCYENMAIALFYWEFNAVWAKNNSKETLNG